MNKELYVSSTPHETKVGIVEDDQLAEIYLERENEYTLAGSIYKGRVTRVLPGMQSAFVDIGLERDAFLYVSDFMDLEQQDEDLDEAIPANRPVAEARPRPGLEAGGPAINSGRQRAEAGGQRVREKSRKRLLRKHRATPRALRATFAGVDASRTPGRNGRPERADVRSAVKFEAKRAVKPAVNHGVNLVTNHAMNLGTTALTAAIGQDAADRNRDSSGRQRPPPIRSRLRLRTASGISTDHASRRIDLEVPATESESSAGFAGRERSRGGAASVGLHRCELS